MLALKRARENDFEDDDARLIKRAATQPGITTLLKAQLDLLRNPPCFDVVLLRGWGDVWFCQSALLMQRSAHLAILIEAERQLGPALCELRHGAGCGLAGQPKRPPPHCERISRKSRCRDEPLVCAVHTGAPKVVIYLGLGSDGPPDVLDDLLVFLYTSQAPLWLCDPLEIETAGMGPYYRAFKLFSLANRLGCADLHQVLKAWLLKLFQTYKPGRHQVLDFQLFKHVYSVWDEEHERVEEKDLWDAWYLALARNAEWNLTCEFFRDVLEKQPVFRRGFMHAMASIIASPGWR